MAYSFNPIAQILQKIDAASSVAWALITGKPSSTAAAIDSAVTASHTQGTDQGLDTGGANAVTAAQAKAGYTHSTVVTGNPHAVTKSDVGLGNVTNQNASTAIAQTHAQNTDTGTTSQTFQLQSGSSGAIIKNNSGTIEARNSGDTDYAPIGIKVIKIPDNVSEALVIQEAGNTYLTFDTTDGVERILLGKNLEVGQLEIATNAGAFTLVDMPITSLASIGTEESYSFKIDGSTVLKIYGESDGAGSVQNLRLVLENGAIIANKKNADIDIGTETVDTFADTLGDGCVWDYVVKNGTNVRTGQIMACWNSSDAVDYAETSTADLGSTADLALSVDISANMVRLLAVAASNNWEVRVIRRVI